MNKYLEFSNKRLCRMLILCIILLFIVTPFKVKGEITWIQQCSLVVHPNSNLTCEGLKINNIQFNEAVRGIKDFNGNIVLEYKVNPNIFFNVFNLSNPVVLTVTDNVFIDETKSIKITASGFTDGNSANWLIESYNPQATLTIYKRQIPQLEVSLRSDKATYEYEQDDNINVTLSIKNIDKESMKTMKIKMVYSGLNTSKTLASAQDSLEHCCLSPDKTIEYIYNFDVADIDKTYGVNATLELQDPYVLNKVIKYNASIKFNVISANVSGRVTVLKYLPSRFYTSDNVTEVITISNQGKHSIYSIEVTDSNDNVLYPTNNQKMYWDIPMIKPDSQETISYVVYPTKSGKFTISGTTVKYNYLGKDSTIISSTLPIEIISNPNKPLRAAISTTPIQNIVVNNTHFNTSKNNNNTSRVQSNKPIVTPTSTPMPINTQNPNVKYIVVNTTPPQDTPPQDTIPGFDSLLVIISIIIIYATKK